MVSFGRFLLRPYSISLESCHERASHALSSFYHPPFYQQSICSPDLAMYPNEDVTFSATPTEKASLLSMPSAEKLIELSS